MFTSSGDENVSFSWNASLASFDARLCDNINMMQHFCEMWFLY